MKKSANILVVEDKDSDYRYIERSFKDLAIAKIICRIESGDEVIPYLEKHDHEIDAIFLDLGLPKLEGDEIISLLKDGLTFVGYQFIY